MRGSLLRRRIPKNLTTFTSTGTGTLRLSSEAKGAGVDVLVLFGSRARGQARPESDWDFGFLTKQDIDHSGLTEALARLTGAEQIDLVDLDRANGLLRYLVAAEGVLVYERREGAFMDFREAADLSTLSPQSDDSDAIILHLWPMPSK